MCSIELTKDIDELKALLSQTKRPNVVRVLTNTLSQWQDELEKQLSKKQEECDTENKPAQKQDRSESDTTKPIIYQKQIDTYAWDQSHKYVKLYITIPAVQTLCKDNISCDFAEQSYKLVVKELNNYTYTHQLTRLLHPVNATDSFVKIKSDCVLVMLKKEKEGETWTYVTRHEKDKKERKKPDVKPDADPQDSLMGMLKDMYDDGDDDMKRTIKKAFYESRMKKPGEGGISAMDDL